MYLSSSGCSGWALLHLCVSVWSALLSPDHSWQCTLGPGQRQGCRQGPGLYQTVYLFSVGVGGGGDRQKHGCPCIHRNSCVRRETPHQHTPLRHVVFILLFIVGCWKLEDKYLPSINMAFFSSLTQPCFMYCIKRFLAAGSSHSSTCQNVLVKNLV